MDKNFATEEEYVAFKSACSERLSNYISEFMEKIQEKCDPITTLMILYEHVLNMKASYICSEHATIKNITSHEEVTKEKQFEIISCINLVKIIKEAEINDETKRRLIENSPEDYASMFNKKDLKENEIH